MEPRSRCNNAIHVLTHFKKLGIKESTILSGLSVDKEYLSNPHNWITVKDWYKLMDNCQEAAPLTTLADWNKIGFYLKDSEGSKLFEMITKLVGVKNMYKLVPKYNNSFNTYMEMNLHAIGSDYAEYTIKTDESVVAEGIGLMVRYTSGVCSIIPHIIFQKPAKVDILYDQAHLKNVIVKLYKSFDFHYFEKNNFIFLNNKKIGRKIQLLKSSPTDKIYSNKYSFEEPYNATLLVEDLIVDGKILLNKDDIFDAPCGRVLFKWENQTRFLKIFKSTKLKNETLTYLNEQIFLAEQRHFESESLRVKEKQYIKQLQSTLKELVSIEEKERKIIAEELHDTVTQTLGFGISKFKNAIGDKLLQEDRQFLEVQQIFEQALEEVRSLTVQISSPTLHFLSFEEALEDLAFEVRSKHGIQINFSNKIEKPLNLKDSLQTILYRSVRELFMNTIKHSKSNEVILKISMEDESLHINFEDNGIGFDSSILNNNSKSSFGLFSINERIKILNGQFQIDSESGKGTKIGITVPLRERSENTQYRK